jgi:hypothetical protein
VRTPETLYVSLPCLSQRIFTTQAIAFDAELVIVTNNTIPLFHSLHGHPVIVVSFIQAGGEVPINIPNVTQLVPDHPVDSGLVMIQNLLSTCFDTHIIIHSVFETKMRSVDSEHHVEVMARTGR